MATVVGPLILAFVMVLVMGDARFALLAMLSPVLGVGTWFEQKRRRKHEIEEEDERFAGALESFVAQWTPSSWPSADVAATRCRIRRSCSVGPPCPPRGSGSDGRRTARCSAARRRR